MRLELSVKRASLKADARIFRPHWRLRKIGLRVQPGERIGILGANGAGKTSLARLLAGLDRPSAGRVRRHPRKARVLLSLQRPEDHFIMSTVADEIVSYSKLRLTLTDVEQILAVIGLDPALAVRSPRTLSSGQQRSLSVACGLAARASLLVLDEPMAGLDGTAREQVMRVLRLVSQTQEIAIGVISHHPDDLLGWAQRLWVISGGRLVYDGAFSSVPLDVLNEAVGRHTPSVFCALREFESTGYSLPLSIYEQTDPTEIARLLDEALAP